jgi:hypothetical protein
VVVVVEKEAFHAGCTPLPVYCIPSHRISNPTESFPDTASTTLTSLGPPWRGVQLGDFSPYPDGLIIADSRLLRRAKAQHVVKWRRLTSSLSQNLAVFVAWAGSTQTAMSWLHFELDSILAQGFFNVAIND